MRAFDKYAIEACHVPGMVLMENAGRGAADVISAIIDARRAALQPAAPADLLAAGVGPAGAPRPPSLLPPPPSGVSPGVRPSMGPPGMAPPGGWRSPRRHPDADAFAARARSFPVRHVPSPGQPAT